MKSHAHLLLALLTPLLLPFGIARALDYVPSRVDRIGNSVAVRFGTVRGRAYRIEHTEDFVTWTFYPDTIYGLGQSARYHVYDATPPNQNVPVPANVPQPAEEFFFMLTAFDDGSAVATWTGGDGSPAKAYLPSFDLRYPEDGPVIARRGQVMQEMVRCIV